MGAQDTPRREFDRVGFCVMFFSAPRTGILCVLGTVLIAGMGCKAGAQTTGTVTPAPAEASAKDQPSSAKDGPPPGGCMPIGVTVSGEIVFPFQCKDFIDQHKAAKQDHMAPEDRPDNAQEKTAAKQPDSMAPEVEVKVAPEVKAPEATAPAATAPAATTPEPKAPESAVQETAAPAVKATETAVTDTLKPAAEPVVKTPSSKRARLDSSNIGPPGCTHFRTYDHDSQTYVAYGGGRRPCR